MSTRVKDETVRQSREQFPVETAHRTLPITQSLGEQQGSRKQLWAPQGDDELQRLQGHHLKSCMRYLKAVCRASIINQTKEKDK